MLWILPTLVALLSFIAFLMHRRKYIGETAIAIRQTWAALQFSPGIALLVMRLPLWLEGNPEDIVFLWIIVPFILTGISMMVLNSKDRHEFIDRRSARLQGIIGVAFFVIILVVAILPLIILTMILRNNPQWMCYFPILFPTVLVIMCVSIIILLTVFNKIILPKFKKKD